VSKEVRDMIFPMVAEKLDLGLLPGFTASFSCWVSMGRSGRSPAG
jgi:hypothetical protein